MIAIIVPCYNEEFRFDVGKWNILMQLVPRCTWIYVDDGSSDQTFLTLSKLEPGKCHILRLETNVGKGEAIRAGLNFALTSDFSDGINQIGYLDADGAFAMEDIIRMIEFSAEQFLVNSKLNSIISSRVKLAGREISRNARRHYLGRVIGTYIGMSWKEAPYDTQSGFKIFRVDSYFQKAITEQFQTRWFFDIELLLRLHSISESYPWEFPLTKWNEVGNSRIDMQQVVLIFREILRIRRIIRKNLVTEGVQNGFN